MWLREFYLQCEIIELGEKGCHNGFMLLNDCNNNEKKVLELCSSQKYLCIKNVMCLKMWYCDNYIFNLY